MSESLIATPAGSLSIQKIFPADGELVKLSLVLPTYNESKNIVDVVEQLTKILDQALQNDYELVVVDDDSPDKTWQIAQSLTEDFPRLRVMRRQGEKGLSSAIIRGWQASRGSVLGVIDADLQHPPETLLQLWQAMENDVDLAVASRHCEGGGVSRWSIVRRVLSRGAQILGLIILPGVVGRVSDPMSGYFLIRRNAIEGPRLSPIGYKILLEVIGRGNVEDIAEVGYVFRERVSGESKVTAKQYGEYILHLVRLRSQGRLGRLRKKIPWPTARFIKFCLVGFSGVFVDMAVLYLLSDPIALHWGLTRSKIIAAEIAIINNFLWNDSWTFKSLASRQNTLDQKFKRFLKFNAICILGLVINVIILNTLFNTFSINRYLANLLAILIVTVWNFWINLKLNWRVTSK
jgi:dolichol-phosphate mannosyltransferase